MGMAVAQVSDLQHDPLAVWDSGEVIYLAALPKGPITVLEGTAAVIWREAMAGPLEAAADRVASATGLESEQIRGSVDEFVGLLVAQGLLTRSR
jgi:hypothetical protein